MYEHITCDYFEVVEQLQTSIVTILNVCTHYLWLFESVEQLQSSIITILNVCSDYFEVVRTVSN